MKDKIYWSMLHKSEDFFKNDEDYGMYAVMALTENPNTEFCLVISDDLLGRSFNTEREALQYVKELQKPSYYTIFGNNYELIYMEPLSKEFLTLMRKREKYMVELFDLVDKLTEEEERPFWKKDVMQYIRSNNPFTHVLSAFGRIKELVLHYKN